MDAKIGNFFEPVSNIFSGGDVTLWCDHDIIAARETEPDENDRLAKLQRKLVEIISSSCTLPTNWRCSKRIGILEASLENTSSIAQKWEGSYLLAVKHFWNGDYLKNRTTSSIVNFFEIEEYLPLFRRLNRERRWWRDCRMYHNTNVHDEYVREFSKPSITYTERLRHLTNMKVWPKTLIASNACSRN